MRRTFLAWSIWKHLTSLIHKNACHNSRLRVIYMREMLYWNSLRNNKNRVFTLYLFLIDTISITIFFKYTNKTNNQQVVQMKSSVFSETITKVFLTICCLYKYLLTMSPRNNLKLICVLFTKVWRGIFVLLISCLLNRFYLINYLNYFIVYFIDSNGFFKLSLIETLYT